MKKKLAVIALFGAACLASPNVADAHEYDRGDSDHPLRYVAYLLHPVGIAAEYAILRPIHSFVSSTRNTRIWFGHNVVDGETDDYMAWE